MKDDALNGPGDKPTKRYEPIEPDAEPEDPADPAGWEAPDPDAA